MKTNLHFVHVLAVMTVLLTLATAQNDRSAQLVTRAEKLMTTLDEGRFDEVVADFNSKMADALPATKLKAVWNQITAQVGAFSDLSAARITRMQGNEIVIAVCRFERGQLNVRVVFDNDQKIAGLFFTPGEGMPAYDPPSYVSKTKFFEVDTVISSQGYTLKAVLTIPDKEGTFPAVVLVHGSGPADEDETVGPNKPFRDLAWGLASRNIAVLRYVKRTKAYPQKMDSLKNEITVMQETIEDALSAVSFLRGIAEIDYNNVYILGHSLGGMLLPRMARLYPRISGFIMMAAPSRPLQSVLAGQYRYIFESDGVIDTLEQRQLRDLEGRITLLNSDALTEETPADSLPLQLPAVYWMDLLQYDQVETAKSIRQPLLILQGGRDYQVTMQDLDGWKEALQEKENVRFIDYPQLNHLFIAGDQKSVPAEYLIPGHVDEKVILDIAGWISRQNDQ